MLSPNHRQHLMVAFRHLDESLTDVLARMGARPGVPLFQPAQGDCTDAMRVQAEASAAALRAQIRLFMAHHDMRPGMPHATASHVAGAVVDLLMVNAAELGASHLRGYGELSADAQTELDALADRLREELHKLDRALRPDP